MIIITINNDNRSNHHHPRPPLPQLTSLALKWQEGDKENYPKRGDSLLTLESAFSFIVLPSCYWPIGQTGSFHGRKFRSFMFWWDIIVYPCSSNVCCHHLLRMHYVGTFKQTGEIFDSSKKAGQPIGFQVGMRQAGRFFVKKITGPNGTENFWRFWEAKVPGNQHGQVIRGWDEGVTWLKFITPPWPSLGKPLENPMRSEDSNMILDATNMKYLFICFIGLLLVSRSSRRKHKTMESICPGHLHPWNGKTRPKSKCDDGIFTLHSLFNGSMCCHVGM